ncbi:MAG: poly(A) polymerase [Gammaproteobacteria bacterium]|jgi:poly(A) polymerase|nr:poly(A) polymerase [Gammaproteobacteria bacterium]|tara:strand:- start:166 stop:1443 length:1278 start_codon:yes stop_codon:yes gene_type:complete
MLNFFRRTKKQAPKPNRINEHSLRTQLTDANALNVIKVLNANGFQAYLVGGCVRDALCGVKPKDFDVATDAPLEAVSKLFRRSRIVGRRFPIVHVRFGRDLIEVSTFRQSISDKVVHDDRGMILRDNAFGTLHEDAFRRDFTTNALYYDPSNDEIIDFVDGIKDIKQKRLRFIGNTRTRLAEDPVRMLRAMRFSAKLGFAIDPEILRHAKESANSLEAVSPARLFDEFIKLFLNGYAEVVWRQLRETPLANALFPCCDPNSPLVLAAMRNTDERILGGASVTPGFLVAVLLWDDFCARSHDQATLEDDPAFATLKHQQSHIAVPRRFGTFAREVWLIQERLHKRNPRSLDRLASHKRFRAGYDFLCLQAESDELMVPIADWWTEFQSADESGRQALIAQLPKAPRKRRRNRSRRKPTESAPEESS